MQQSSRVKDPGPLVGQPVQEKKPHTHLMLEASVGAYLKSPLDLSLPERGLRKTKFMVKRERPLEQQISHSQEPVLGLLVVTFG